MVKKANNPLKIDYQNGLIEDRLLQIRNFKDVNTPKLSMYFESPTAIEFELLTFGCIHVYIVQSRYGV